MKPPRNRQDLRAEHSRAAADSRQGAKPSEKAVPEPTRPSQVRAPSPGSTDIERFVQKGAEAARHNSPPNLPTHKLDKASGKAQLEADLKAAKERSGPPKTDRDDGRDR